MNLEVDSVDLITGSGEIKKRKKGFNGDLIFKYKEKEILAVTLNQEAKSKVERNYLVKVKTPWRSYTSNVKVNKEKKGNVKYETKFCRNEGDKCISIDVQHKEAADLDELQISYRRGDVEFSIERIRVSTRDLSRFHTVIYKGDKRYGYDLRVAKEGIGNSLSLGIIIPSREIVMKTYAEVSFRKPRVKFEFSADAQKHPERKLITDVKFDNHLMDNSPSKLDVIISHPIYEKPIELQLIGDYEPTSNKYLKIEMSADYSNDPEDKLISKISFESSKSAKTMIWNMYHKDDQHLDVVLKVNASMADDEEYYGMIWNWKDEGDADKEAFMVYQLLEKDRKFHFEYNRPKFVYRLDGAIITPKTLLGDTCEVDLTSVYNGVPTKAKLITDYNTGCYTLNILNEEGKTTRIIEMCRNDKSRKTLSIVMESLDEEGQWQFDYSIEVVRKGWRTVNVRNNYNPEFFGAMLFKLTSLGDELSAAGVGTLPFYNSPRMKKIRSSFHSKLFQPSLRFFIPEVARFIADVRRDSQYLGTTLKNYYNSLPPISELKENIEKLTVIIQDILHEVWDSVASYYKEYFKNVIEFVDKATGIVKSVCNNNEDCKAFVKAYHDRGLKGLCDQVKVFIRSLPAKVREFMNRPGVDARKFYDSAMTLVKAALKPLENYKCGELVVQVVKLTYEKLEPHIQHFLENYPTYYRNARQAIMTNKYVIKSAELAKETYEKIKGELEKIDFQKLYDFAVKSFEEFLFNFSPPSIRKAMKINALDTERGNLDFDFHVATPTLNSKFLRRINDVVDTIVDGISSTHTYGWNTILVKFKRGADLNFFPPYEAQAMIVANQHFVTFDKTFYDFAGECVHLLSRDFEDGNFTFILKPNDGDKSPSIITLIKDVSIEVNSGEKTVHVADAVVELPYISKDFTVSLSGSTVIVNDRHGVQVRCNLVRQVCSFSISGWYYGKTAGLLGTYNYEPADEFKRPKGQIANSAAVMAKSWELKKGCKSNNLASDDKVDERSDKYKICKAHFEETTSPLAACFYEVDPKEYFQLCLSMLARPNDPTQELCKVSTAYVMECERNYIELNLPSKCLTCTAPDGSALEHGDRKKFGNLNKRTADVVFVIEDNDCNKAIVNDLGSLARSIERELQNDGYKDTVFGVVAYGGDYEKPAVFTVHGETSYNSREISAIKDRLKLESKKIQSSAAFDAMQLAVTSLFRSETAKSIVLLSCNSCKYDYTSWQYPVTEQILLERGISLHVMSNAEITVRKSKEKDIIGADPETVYHSKDVTQQELTGEPALRSQVTLPKDLCVALSQSVNGSFFSTHSLHKASALDIKNWRSVFARKFLKAVQSFQCQLCDCTSTRDHVPRTVCQPCEAKRPRLPFSVCKSCALPRTVESFLSYVLQLTRK